MASIVAQQDLFFLFDFDFEDTNETEINKSVTQCKDDIFLIGCFRSGQKKQIEWIRSSRDELHCGKYNVRLGKGRNGWINKDNPRISNPNYVILYEFNNEDTIFYFKSSGSIVYTEEDMRNAGYEQPQGDYLVYNLVQECNFTDIDVKKILERYRERTNWIDGKPIYMSGREIISAMRPPRKNNKKEEKQEHLFAEQQITLEQVIAQINYDFHYRKDALTSIDLFSGCGGLTKGLSMAGIRSILGSDIDENCEKTFCRNFPGVPFLRKDITSISKEEVDVLLGDVVPDIIVGGPPCQGFSLANKRRNKVSDDPRYLSVTGRAA